MRYCDETATKNVRYEKETNC